MTLVATRMVFQLKHYMLPHDGIIPGARGHKKVIVPAGTRVFCIVYGTLIYWAAYLDEGTALKCIDGLEASLDPKAKRHIPLKTLLEWNFKHSIPKRIVRPRL